MHWGTYTYNRWIEVVTYPVIGGQRLIGVCVCSLLNTKAGDTKKQQGYPRPGGVRRGVRRLHGVQGAGWRGPVCHGDVHPVCWLGAVGGLTCFGRRAGKERETACSDGVPDHPQLTPIDGTHQPTPTDPNRTQRWRKELTWRCFLVSAITIVVVRYLVSTCVAHGRCAYLQWGSLAWFNQAYPSPYAQVGGFCCLAAMHVRRLGLREGCQRAGCVPLVCAW
jgi:hypothetical protein